MAKTLANKQESLGFTIQGHILLDALKRIKAKSDPPTDQKTSGTPPGHISIPPAAHTKWVNYLCKCPLSEVPSPILIRMWDESEPLLREEGVGTKKDEEGIERESAEKFCDESAAESAPSSEVMQNCYSCGWLEGRSCRSPKRSNPAACENMSGGVLDVKCSLDWKPKEIPYVCPYQGNEPICHWPKPNCKECDFFLVHVSREQRRAEMVASGESVPDPSLMSEKVEGYECGLCGGELRKITNPNVSIACPKCFPKTFEVEPPVPCVCAACRYGQEKEPWICGKPGLPWRKYDAIKTCGGPENCETCRHFIMGRDYCKKWDHEACEDGYEHGTPEMIATKRKLDEEYEMTSKDYPKVPKKKEYVCKNAGTLPECEGKGGPCKFSEPHGRITTSSITQTFCGVKQDINTMPDCYEREEAGSTTPEKEYKKHLEETAEALQSVEIKRHEPWNTAKMLHEKLKATREAFCNVAKENNELRKQNTALKMKLREKKE